MYSYLVKRNQLCYVCHVHWIQSLTCGDSNFVVVETVVVVAVLAVNSCCYTNKCHQQVLLTGIRFVVVAIVVAVAVVLVPVL